MGRDDGAARRVLRPHRERRRDRGELRGGDAASRARRGVPDGGDAAELLRAPRVPGAGLRPFADGCRGPAAPFCGRRRRPDPARRRPGVVLAPAGLRRRTAGGGDRRLLVLVPRGARVLSVLDDEAVAAKLAENIADGAIVTEHSVGDGALLLLRRPGNGVVEELIVGSPGALLRCRPVPDVAIRLKTVMASPATWTWSARSTSSSPCRRGASRLQQDRHWAIVDERDAHIRAEGARGHTGAFGAQRVQVGRGRGPRPARVGRRR